MLFGDVYVRVNPDKTLQITWALVWYLSVQNPRYNTICTPGSWNQLFSSFWRMLPLLMMYFHHLHQGSYVGERSLRSRVTVCIRSWFIICVQPQVVRVSLFWLFTRSTYLLNLTTCHHPGTVSYRNTCSICVHQPMNWCTFIYQTLGLVHSAHLHIRWQTATSFFWTMYNVTACSMTGNDQLIFINLVKIVQRSLERIEGGFVILHWSYKVGIPSRTV
jgi:hypothetical protein